MPHSSCSALHGVNTTLTDGLIERTSPMLDEIESKTMHKYKEGDQQRKKEVRQSEAKPVQEYAMQRMWGRFFWNLPVFLTKCVDKISRPNVVDKFGVFFDKKWNTEFYHYPVPQKSNCCRWWRLFNPLIHNVPKWSDTL